jgi:hypothetical protein
MNTQSLMAASITWGGATDNTWATASNWVGGVAPVSDITTDDALFTNAGSRVIDFGSGASVSSIVIQGTTTGSNGLTFGTAGQIVDLATLSADGIQVLSAKTGDVITVAATTRFSTNSGDFSFINSSTNASSLVVTGGIINNRGAKSNIYLGSSATANTSTAATNVYSGVITGTGNTALDIAIGYGGAVGRWALSNPSNNTGGNVLVRSGTALIDASGAAGLTAIYLGHSTTSVNTALLLRNNITLTNSIIVGGNGANSNAQHNLIIGTEDTSGTSTLSGAVTFSTNTVNYTPVFQAASGGTFVYSGTFGTTNNKGLTIGTTGNTGTVQINNAFTSTGGITAAFGTLRVNTNTIGTGTPLTIAGGNVLTYNELTNSGGSLNMSSGSMDINSTGAGSVTFASGTNVTMSGGTWSVSLGSGSGVAGGSDQFISLGSGTFNLSGGTIALSGSYNPSISYTLLSGFSSGTIGGGVSFTGVTSGYNASLSNTGVLTFTSSIPEPSTYGALAGLAILGFAALRRKGRTSASQA